MDNLTYVLLGLALWCFAACIFAVIWSAVRGRQKAHAKSRADLAWIVRSDRAKPVDATVLEVRNVICNVRYPINN